MVDYSNALKTGQKQYKKAIRMNENPYPEVLSELLKEVSTAGMREAGTFEIPLDLIVGTKDAGRSNAFTKEFYPLLSEDSEFADKWKRLFDSQMEEGLRDAIKVYEYKNRYYVEEGNKRVSIAKYLKMPKILASVTRILPRKDDSAESKRYYESLRFYEKTHLCNILFSEYGSYEKMLRYLGKTWEDSWTEDEIRRLNVIFYHFTVDFLEFNPQAKPEEVGDGFLSFLEIMPYEETKEKSSSEIREDVLTMKPELKTTEKDQPIHRILEPEEIKPTLVDKIIPSGILSPSAILTPGKIVQEIHNPGKIVQEIHTPSVLSSAKKKMRVAFIYDESPEKSDWIYAHELGRAYVEEVFGDKVETISYTYDANRKAESKDPEESENFLTGGDSTSRTGSNDRSIAGNSDRSIAGNSDRDIAGNDRFQERKRDFSGQTGQADYSGLAEVLEKMVLDGVTVLFTTSPNMMPSAVKTALKYPNAYFFNCSINFSYKTVQTYYVRMYEIKFLTGLIAGVMSQADYIHQSVSGKGPGDHLQIHQSVSGKGPGDLFQIDYEAAYPIYGTIAEINAFAMGVQMVNPHAKVRLIWTCMKDMPEADEDNVLVSAKKNITSREKRKITVFIKRRTARPYTMRHMS